MRIDSSNLFALSQALPTYNLLMSRFLSLRYIKINADYFCKTHLEQPEDWLFTTGLSFAYTACLFNNV